MNEIKQLALQNAEYIKQLNHNLSVINKNISTINEALKTSIKELARDVAAMQRALVEFLQHKKIIDGEEDAKFLKKLHIQHISRLDQEIAEKRDESK